MKARPEGTYPRRLIKRTHNHNPTFHSYNVLGVLNLDSNPQSWAYQYSPAQNNKQSTYLSRIHDGDLGTTRKQSVHKTIIATPKHEKLANLHKKQSNDNQTIPTTQSRPRSKSTNKLQMDSLNIAQEDFTKNRMRNPLNYISGRLQSGNKISYSPGYQINPSYNQQSISEKQKANYNIINFSRI